MVGETDRLSRQQIECVISGAITAEFEECASSG